MGAENLTPTGIRSPNRPAHSELLYRMRHPPPLQTHTHVVYIIFVGKPNVNRRLGRPKIKWEVNIKMNLENTVGEVVARILLDCNRAIVIQK